jgi:hypothetical protein
LADIVAKVFWGDERKFSEPLTRPAPRDKRPPVFVSAVKGFAAVAAYKNRSSQIFRAFDFRLLQQAQS